jgi:uncharacterized protein YjbI with pentapeptide repeats
MEFSNLKEANLEGAELLGAVMNHCLLVDTRLDYANLKAAQMRSCLMMGIGLRNADVAFALDSILARFFSISFLVTDIGQYVVLLPMLS